MLKYLLRASAAALAVSVLTLTPAAVGGATAQAHTGLQSSTPADGEQLTAPPDSVTLTFSQAVNAEYVQVAVTGPDGTSIATGPARVEGPVVTQPVTATADGAHTVAFRVVSVDGHPVSGQLAFTLNGVGPAPTGAAPPSSTPAPDAEASDTAEAAAEPAAATQDTSATGWWIGLAAVVVVAAGLLAATLLRRRRGPAGG